jgi:Transglutaminase-like superfamily
VKIVSKWRSFSRLSSFEHGVLIEALVALVATRAGLRLVGFRRWENFLARFTPTLKSQNFDVLLTATAQVVARTESVAARNIFFRPSCLERSLVLWWLLRRRGIRAEVRVGARGRGANFEAHAWIECDGTFLNEGESGHHHFVPFDGPITSTGTRAP